jgi:hypothetical protein
MAYDGSGSLFALGIRVTKLDPTGAPLIGATNSYVSKALITMGLGLEYEDGQAISQRSGSGDICLAFQAPATLKQGTISDLQLCSPDPDILPFLIGGSTFTRADVDEVQTATITGAPTGGTFTLTFEGDTTAGIAFDAAAGDVQTALEALPDIDPGDVAVTGAAGGPYTFTWLGSLGDVSSITASGAGLTGGINPGVTMATTTTGSDMTSIGYAAPAVGVDPLPDGVSLELWSRAVQNGAYAAELPYFHWVIPRAYLRPSEAWVAGGESPMLPGFEGYSNENVNWGDGPAGDWAYTSDRVWQYARVATIPDLTAGFRAVA